MLDRLDRVWRRLRPWLLPLAIVLVLVALPNVPGRWNTDTGVMVEQMRARQYDDIWSPFITWLWQPLYLLGFGAAWLMFAQVVVLTLAIGMVLRRSGMSLRSARIVTVLLMLSPPVYAAAISVMRDTWFLCSLMVMIAVALGPRTRGNVAMLAVASVLAVGSRQNASASVAVVLVWAALRWWPLPSRVRRWGLALGGGLAVTIVIVTSIAVWRNAAGVASEHPETATFVGDLDEMSTRVGENLMPTSVVDPPLTMDEFRTSSIYALDTLWFYDQRASLRQPPEVHAEIRDAWVDAVKEHPVVYLHGRWKLFTRQIGWSGPPVIAFFPEDLGGGRAPTPAFLGMAAAATDYLSLTTHSGSWRLGGWVHRVWLWWLVSAVMYGGWWWARGRTDPPSWLFTLPFPLVTAHLALLAFVAPHAQYRFVEAMVVIAEVCTAAAIAALVRSRAEVESA